MRAGPEFDVTYILWDFVRLVRRNPYEKLVETELFKRVSSYRSEYPYATYLVSGDSFIPWHVASHLKIEDNRFHFDEARDMYVFPSFFDLLCGLESIARGFCAASTLNFDADEDTIVLCHGRADRYIRFMDEVYRTGDVNEVTNLIDNMKW
jgi:hypothetical protein